MILKRIKRAYKALKGDDFETVLMRNPKTGTTETLEVFMGEIGDGNAEFLGEGSQEEYKESENERKGFKNIFGIGK